MIKGNGVSTGIGFGTVVVLRKENKQIEKNVVENPEEEMKRFKEALSKVTDETEQIVEKASGTEREIMNAYQIIMQNMLLKLDLIVLYKSLKTWMMNIWQEEQEI